MSGHQTAMCRVVCLESRAEKPVLVGGNLKIVQWWR
jgi:hypothetical protein